MCLADMSFCSIIDEHIATIQMSVHGLYMQSQVVLQLEPDLHTCPPATCQYILATSNTLTSLDHKEPFVNTRYQTESPSLTPIIVAHKTQWIHQQVSKERGGSGHRDAVSLT